MDIFRNPEFKQSAIFYLILTVAASVCGFLAGFRYGVTALSVSLLFCAASLFTSLRRYNKIAELSREIDSILHGIGGVLSAESGEGELAILRSEIYKMTVMLRSQADELEEERRFLENSMADISHQLRTPLTSLTLLLSMLTAPETAPEKKAQLSRDARSLIGRIDWLVSSMLMMSKIDAGTARFRRDKVDARELITLASEPLAIPMELREQSFTVDMNGDESFTGDLSWSVEAVVNILKNAMEHTPEGGEIRVACTENPLFTEFIISDNGPGICPEDLPHIFERFYRGRDSAPGSAGIGLALSHMIVRSQNGTLKAKNSPYGGSKFIIRFYKSTI